MRARLQSIRLAQCSRVSNSRCSFVRSLASCLVAQTAPTVTPEPYPISRGSIFHGRPVRRTNSIPVRVAWLGTRGRPPFARTGITGRSGSIITPEYRKQEGWPYPPIIYPLIKVQRVLKGNLNYGEHFLILRAPNHDT